jgi:hypothetical protein
MLLPHSCPRGVLAGFVTAMQSNPFEGGAIEHSQQKF